MRPSCPPMPPPQRNRSSAHVHVHSCSVILFALLLTCSHMYLKYLYSDAMLHVFKFNETAFGFEWRTKRSKRELIKHSASLLTTILAKISTSY